MSHLIKAGVSCSLELHVYVKVFVLWYRRRCYQLHHEFINASTGQLCTPATLIFSVMFALCTFVLKSANLIEKNQWIKPVLSDKKDRNSCVENIFMYEGGHVMERERVRGVRREKTCHQELVALQESRSFCQPLIRAERRECTGMVAHCWCTNVLWKHSIKIS